MSLPKPRLLIDARMVREVPHGFARYVTALATGLHRLRETSDLLYQPVFLMSPEYGHQALAPEIFKHFETVSSRSQVHHWRELMILPQEIKAARIDLFHSPSYVSLLSCPCPHLNTIHDLNHLIYGEWTQKQYYRFVLKPFLRRARKVLTVSEFSRGEIARWLSLPPEEILVVPNAMDAGPESSAPEAALSDIRPDLVPGRYFLALSNAKEHKNLSLLVKAYRQARESGTELWPLVLSVEPQELGVSAREPGILCVGQVDEPRGRALLNQCGVVPFPSLYEGFGLPPLEAALAGKAVLVSDIPPHREALQDFRAGEILWLNPREPAEWAKAFMRISRGETRLVPADSATVARARERFSVARLGRDMDRIYRGVLGLPL